MKFKYIKNVVNTNNVEMYLYGEIGGEGIDAQQFADELNYLANYSSATNVMVRICSEGGIVIKGIAIFSAIANANKAGKIQVDTCNDGVCASIAGIILLAGKNRYGKSFCRTMIHGVSLDENDKDLTDNDRAAMASLQTMISEVLTENAGKSAKFFEGLLSNGKDNWFDASESIRLGILTELEPETEETASAAVYMNAADSPKETVQKLKSFYNSITQKTDMKKIVMKLNQLPRFKNAQLADTAPESQIEGVVGEVIDENVKLSADLEAEKAKTGDLQTKLDAAVTETATAEVKNAIALGKFAATAETTLVEQAKKDLPAFRALCASINTPAMRIVDRIKGEETPGIEDKIKGKTFREIEKMQGGDKILNALRTSNVAKYVDLYNAQYNTTKTAADFK